MAALGGESARPDVLVFPLVAEVRPGLCLPFLDAADSRRRRGGYWWDADRGAARPVCSDMAAALPEVLQDPQAVAAEKSAAREPVPADVVPDRLAWALSPERPAWDVLAERSVQRRVAEALCIPDADQFAA
jgi:hypothetical protein